MLLPLYVVRRGMKAVPDPHKCAAGGRRLLACSRTHNHDSAAVRLLAPIAGTARKGNVGCAAVWVNKARAGLLSQVPGRFTFLNRCSPLRAVLFFLSRLSLSLWPAVERSTYVFVSSQPFSSAPSSSSPPSPTISTSTPLPTLRRKSLTHHSTTRDGMLHNMEK